MKQLLFLIPLFLVLSCSKSQLTENDIAGKWKVVEFDIDLYEMNQTMEAIIRDIALSTVYQFEKDGSWESSNNKGASQLGNWSYNEKKGELTMTSPTSEDDQVWVYQDDFKFEYQFENRAEKRRSVIEKE